MNLGKFNGAVWALKEEFKDMEVLQHLKTLKKSLSQSVAQPNAETAEAFKESLEELKKTLSGCPSNEATPSRRRIFKELKAENKIGLGILFSVQAIIQKNSITPADALAKIAEFIKEVNSFHQTIDSLAVDLDTLEVEYDELEEGEYEIGILIPEDILRKSLSNVQKELKCINELLRVISEVATGKPKEFSLHTIGSTDMQVFFNTASTVAACLAVIIERIVALYKNQLEIKKIKAELEKMNTPATVTTPLDKHITELVQKELDLITKDIINDYYKKKDSGRKNELKAHLNHVLNYMTERIDKGAVFEVCVGLPDKPEKPNDEDEVERLVYRRKFAAYEKECKDKKKLNEAGGKVGEIGQCKEEILMLPEPYEPEDGGVDMEEAKLPPEKPAEKTVAKKKTKKKKKKASKK